MTHHAPPRGGTFPDPAPASLPVWIPKLSDLTLCLSGYPIRIRLHVGRARPYTLECDGEAERLYFSLGQARIDALRSAACWDARVALALAE
ncbi:hypothetical protein NON00_00180 [Roseomonas sp. GC11]|uniref:hypothetical protein n=1 Tax=Roseomonas sp. GC11 TaxID=2950546 RepID=UPI00210A9E15|nr:hypothetical protein [Roseomonas sp. GC11]MCQ4158343.1 hypothetical protein [Roseomonas sp. GC11]